jgi:dihydroorotate dehydrogenase
MLYSLIRPLLFQLEPEHAHALALKFLSYFPLWGRGVVNTPPISAMGLEFPHCLGLAAGLDVDADYLDALASLGVAFIEVGTVTPKPQIGNPRPRIFRLPKAQALINRMGLNNKGVDALAMQLTKTQYKGVLGISIGKNKETDLNLAAEDYLYCLRAVYKQASYVTINISSPNTPNLRLLQQDNYLPDLLGKLGNLQQELAQLHQKAVPLVVKVSPDESDETLKRMAETIVNCGVSGVIATNTTRSREAVAHLPNAKEEGGLSGKPLEATATRCLATLKAELGDAVTLIGLGGIDSPESAKAKLDAGAQLLQLYTGLIYQGPGLISRIVQGLQTV